MSVYERLLRPALFRLPADTTNSLAHAALRFGAPWRMFGALAQLDVADQILETRFAGVTLKSPIGLAAGFDKDCELIPALSALGFGFLTVGSIMPLPRPGHVYPRLVRYPDKESLADSMGLPSRGLGYSVERLRDLERPRVPVFANIGGFSADEITDGLFAVEPYVAGVEISLMCPNIGRAAETFDDVALLRRIVERIKGRMKPAVVRVPNDTARSERLKDLIECAIEGGLDGLKIAGGRPVEEPGLGAKRGTLHGAMVSETALDNLRRAAAIARGRIPIKANGGARTGRDVLAMLQAGAVCVDLYSAFIYQGWSVARRINLELAALLREPNAAPDVVAAPQASRAGA
jgi:dihydroorotate dehydrogenase (fumarate)/dihydroorotate dehydrogenase